MICPDTFVCDGAFAHQVGKCVDMAARLPDGGMQDDRGIEADDIVAVTGHRAPPGLAEVTLQFGSQWAIVPKSANAPVDFGGLEDEAASLGQADDLFHAGFGVCCVGHWVKEGKDGKWKSMKVKG